MKQLIRSLKEEERFSTAHIYQSTLNAFMLFCKTDAIRFNQMERSRLKQFENHLRNKGCTWNTVSTYMRTLRSIYNKAVDDGLAEEKPRLFRHVYTGVKANTKRALDAKDMSKLLNVSSSPHVRSNETTQSIMMDVAIAMLPATAFGVFQFGLHALLVLIVTIAACVLSEYVFEKITKRPCTISDFSAVVTGMILALNMPPEIALWIPALGGVFAIIIVKQLYGGLGQNFMNPALAARCFLLISFTGQMSAFTLDGWTGATPLAVLKAGESVDVAAMFIGKIPGTIGEVSVIALLIGAAYLVVKKVITLRIPLTYILTTAVFVFIFGQQDLNYVLAHICGGGLIFGAFFMATDYVTSPITPKGQIVFGILLGILTGLFRIFGGSAEGVSYAIIISNLLVPLIERFTLPTPFGKEGKKS